MEFIDLKQQYRLYKSEISERLQRVLDHGQFIMGPEIAELEQALASYAGVKHCLTVASGTDSLEIALRALGIGPGDEVITIPFTWISTAEAIGLVGAKSVFVDIDPATFNINVDLIESAITPRTKALLPVSLFGQMPDYDRINAIAAPHGLPVIEDGAQSFGATQRGRRSCGVTTIGSTSFFPAKPLGCYGDGGALFSDDDALVERMRAIRTHGGIKRHQHPFLGMNGRFDTLQAAVLLAKWPHFEWEVRSGGESVRATPPPSGALRGAGGCCWQHPCLCSVHHPRTRSRQGRRTAEGRGYTVGRLLPEVPARATGLRRSRLQVGRLSRIREGVSRRAQPADASVSVGSRPGPRGGCAYRAGN